MEEEKKVSKKSNRKDVVDLSKKRRPTARKRRAIAHDKEKSPKEIPKKNTMKKPRKKMSKSLVALLVIFGILAVGGVSYAAFSFFSADTDEVAPIVALDDEVIEDTIPDNMRRTDGVLVENSEDANKYPVAVMIENLRVVRPQSGLGVANVVYEALAEGGITRFMAIMAGDQLEEIQPVRSARPYYLEWVSEYDALYAHAGGSPDALQAIDGLGINDLDALSKGQYFWRGPGAAPHNLYTSSHLLELGLRDQGLIDKEPNFEPWKFKDEATSGDSSVDGDAIELDFSSGAYNAVFEYSADDNCYKRSHGDGIAHNEKTTGEQLCPKNLVVQVVPPETSAGDKGRISLDVTGEGRVVVFNDGEAVEGTWKKEDRTTRTRFYDENDEEIELVRGQVWISIIPSSKRFFYDGEPDGGDSGQAREEADSE